MTAERLSHCDEIELIRVAQVNHLDEHHKMWARNKLIVHNLGLVHKVVHKFPMKNATCSYDDLFQEGVAGLMHGIDKFDPTKGYRLSTYVYNWITAYVRRYYQNHNRAVRLPVHLADKQLKLNKEIEQLQSELGREPTKDEIAQVNPNANHIQQCIQANVSLNVLVGEDSELESLIADEPVDTDSVMDCEMLLAKLKDEVSPRDYKILLQRYGFIGKGALTLQEVADDTGLTRARAHQIEKKMVKKLQEIAQ